jgi:hypothetical protein
MSSSLCQGERRKQYFDDIWASLDKNGLVPRLPYCGAEEARLSCHRGQHGTPTLLTVLKGGTR